jgi:hypothetical protein
LDPFWGQTLFFDPFSKESPIKRVKKGSFLDHLESKTGYLCIMSIFQKISWTSLPKFFQKTRFSDLALFWS